MMTATILAVAPVARAEYTEGMERYRKAWAAYAAQRFEEADRWAQQAVKADPQNAHAFSLMGELAYLRHDLSAAREQWEKALALNPQLGPLRDQIAQTELEMRLEEQLEPVRLGSLVVRVPRAEPARDELVETISQAMTALEPYFQYRMKRPLAILIYPREGFYGQLHVPTEVLGLFDGKIRIPADGKAAVLWHEYTHAVVYDLSHGRAPRWLHEGLAQEAEVVAKAVRGELVEPRTERPALQALLGIAQRHGEGVFMKASQFYPAAHSLVRYLLEVKGWDRMRALLAALGKGESVENAIQSLYGWDLATLEKRWIAWAKS